MCRKCGGLCLGRLYKPFVSKNRQRTPSSSSNLLVRHDTDQVNASEDEENQPDLYATITVICQDRTQALRLAECENTTLHAVFVCRGDSEHKEEYLEAQRSVLGIEQIIAPDTPQNEPADTPDDETETADAPDLDLSAPVEETPKAEEPDKSAIVISGGSNRG